MGDRMKKLKIIISVFYLITIFYCGNVSAIEFNLNSKNVVLYNLNDNKVLYQKSSNDRTSIASLTKITTAIVAIEKIDDLDKKIVPKLDTTANIAAIASICAALIQLFLEKAVETPETKQKPISAKNLTIARAS